MAEKKLLLGNEAIVQGALEADIKYVASYPGTPSSEIPKVFAKIHKEHNIYFEYSINEKVAVEVAAGAALTGLRSMAVMKHVGVNVAADPLMTLAYVGVKGGYVLISADDPSCHSSQNEQDNRLYAEFINIPMLEPSSAQEAKDMTKYAFELSEQVELPVMIRTTTRINHLRGIVEIGEKQVIDREIEFIKDPRYIERKSAHSRLLDRMKKASQLSEESPLNRVYEFNSEAGEEFCFITSSVSFSYVHDLVEKYGINAKVLKLGFSYPMPEKKLNNFIKDINKVIIVEELEPFIENEIYRLAKDTNPDLGIIGKHSGHFPLVNEYNPEIISKVLMPFCDKIVLHDKKPVTQLPHRYSTMCPGCSHRNTYYAVKRVFGESSIYPNDIGCYALGMVPPIQMGDIWLCMSGGAGMAGGFGHATDTPVVAFIGDGTFIHSGIPALLNAVHNQHNFILVIMDNSITAMTGHQPNPVSEEEDDVRPSTHIDMEQLVQSLGVEQYEVVNPQKINETIKVLREYKEKTGIRVIIARQPCIVNVLKREKKLPKTKKYKIDQTKCTHCGICVNDYSCPAFEVDENNDVQVIESLCIGCGDCVQVCPHKAIVEK